MSAHDEFENTNLSPFEIFAAGQLPIEQRIFSEQERVVKKKPGRPPAKPDSALSYSELERRNKRRKRNREAAQRVRDRLVTTINKLQRKTTNLIKDNAGVWNEIESYRQQIENAKQSIMTLNSGTYSIHQVTRHVSNTDNIMEITYADCELDDVFHEVKEEPYPIDELTLFTKQRRASSVAHINQILHQMNQH